MQTCLEVALERLADLPLKQGTYDSYINTIKVLGLADLPIEKATRRELHNRLESVLNANTRRKHIIALATCLDVHMKVPQAIGQNYKLPPFEELPPMFANTHYRMYAFCMLYAGMRLGESTAKQQTQGNTIVIDRQRLQNGTYSKAKSVGAVFAPEWFVNEYKSFQPTLSNGSIYCGLRRAAKRHGWKTMHPHQLRHAFAMRLVENGAHPEILRRQMRHSNVSISLQYYVNVHAEDISAIMEKF